MNLIPTLSICRMAPLPGLKIILLALPLSGCLKVTGEAKDSFDLENEEPKIDLSGLIFRNEVTNQNEEPQANTAQLEKAERTGDAKLSTPTDDLPDEAVDVSSSKAANTTPESQPELPEQDFSTLSPRDVADFELWKKARSEGSSEYQQFREYLEFKEYQKWLKLQNISEPD